MGAARWLYNAALAAVREKRVPLNLKALRALLLNSDSDAMKQHAWLRDVPYDVRDEAIRDLVKAYQSNLAKKKKNPNHTFDLKFRSRKAPSETIVLHAKHWRGGKFYPSFFGSVTMKYAEALPADELMVYDMRVQRTRLGEYFLCIPQPLARRDENQVPSFAQRVIALDPGVPTFATGYDPSGRVIEVGAKDISRIHRLCHAADKLCSKIDTCPKASKEALFDEGRASPHF